MYKRALKQISHRDSQEEKNSQNKAYYPHKIQILYSTLLFGGDCFISLSGGNSFLPSVNTLQMPCAFPV